MTDSYDHVKHLEMIQSVVSRLSSNSTSLKTWAVTLISGLFALAAKETQTQYVLVAYLPAVTFWSLDAYYLAQERAYRGFFDEVRVEEPEPDQYFSLDASAFTGKRAWASALFSKASSGFYVPLLFTVLIVSIVTR